MPVSYHPSQNIVASTADLLVNTVNTTKHPVGIMGAGVAKAFRDKWPAILPPYAKAVNDETLRPGGCRLFPLPDGRLWAALATKDHWKAPSTYPWVFSGLEELARLAMAASVRSIAIPPPGCGNGGLEWRFVEPVLLAILGDFDLRICAAPSRAAATSA